MMNYKLKLEVGCFKTRINGIKGTWIGEFKWVDGKPIAHGKGRFKNEYGNVWIAECKNGVWDGLAKVTD
jgi:hypothetical protein